MKPIILVSVVLSTALFLIPNAFSHCEMPCGIYGDAMRIDMLKEHIATIEKSMKMIAELSKAGAKNYNQIVRWVSTKENHANQIQHIVSQYFMTQRLKPAASGKKKEYKKYVRQLTLLHEMLVYAMKAKQTTDLANAEKLKTLLASFQDGF